LCLKNKIILKLLIVQKVVEQEHETNTTW